jgi:cytochrome c oxidase cbb3-type subunit 4
MDLGQIQAYAYFFFTAFLVIVLYSYIFHLYKAQRDGTRDYEKYGNLALDDEVSAEPIEKIDESNSGLSKK